MAQTGKAGPVVLRPGALQDGQWGGLLYSQQPERGGPHRCGECPPATGPPPARQPEGQSPSPSLLADSAVTVASLLRTTRPYCVPGP